MSYITTVVVYILLHLTIPFFPPIFGHSYGLFMNKICKVMIDEQHNLGVKAKITQPPIPLKPGILKEELPTDQL